MVCYIVLHYMAIEETISCVNNLKKISKSGKIIIVDNNSTNYSGKVLLDKYNNDNQVFVYLNDVNDGYARGNNKGIKIAKEKYNPDFYVVMNNDVEIVQKDFENLILGIFVEEKFDVLGPDIYSTSQNIHQSPKSTHRITLRFFRKQKKIYERRNKSIVIVPIKCFIKKNNLIKKLVQLFKNMRNGSLYLQKKYDVPLHGACLIFSKQFIQKRENIFFPMTFLYYETEILDYEAQKNNYKIVYNPLLKVFHHQNISTNYSYSKELEKVRFMNQEHLKSIVGFLEKYVSL